jgi:low affinity Fe/Cu permease
MKVSNGMTLVGRPSIFDRFAGKMTRIAGSAWAFLLGVLAVVFWGATGPLFDFSPHWQMAIHTGTTIVTFLMVFLIQQSQNKQSIAINVKLNELLASHEMASNRIVAVENLSEADLETLHAFYSHLAKLAAKDIGLKGSHSLDEAAALHMRKQGLRAGAAQAC